MTAFYRVSMLFLLLPLAGCFGMAPTEVPIPSVETVNPASRNNTLVVMLPGRGDRADAFIREGFEVAGQRNGFDTIAVDAHLGYYMQRSLLDRLHEDIVAPAIAAGYSKIWMLGISMGGLGSLLYASEYPEQVDGVILLAPFLGDRSAIETIVESGPLEEWNGEGEGLKDYEIAIWTWIRDARRNSGVTPLILGYGLSDGMAEGYDRLIDVIRPAGVYTREGGHKWTTWKPLWDEIAAELPL
ncbi:MAG: alpha/beta fold hydrolase [Woeseiaceae bacterium]|nr:alpha/beta fold hydrolase [Woeseiaceae bacterium]NIP20834.1 alpha/beta fold hydrolase [Woeseiaceae bacterium]NIS89627.1 alpha/beta fold hydrolase [Woeseiaceae bacterium]